LSRTQLVTGYNFALVHAGLGSVDSVYDRLADDFGARGDAACWYVTEQPLFDEYRSDNRIERLLTEYRCPRE